MKMEPLKDNISSHKYFYFSGFSELGTHKSYISIPFIIMFLVSLFANSLLIYVVISKRSLHSPMYILIAYLSFVDMSLPLILIPNLLLNVLFNSSGISLSGCVVQMFFIHMLGACQSATLVWMALDRYFAICRPLSYIDHMSLPRFLKFVIPVLIRDVIMVSAVVILAGKVSYCSRNVINHCVCEHMALVELGCGTSINSLVGLLGVFFVTVVDFFCIAASYIIIFHTVLRSGKSKAKALHTCVTHIMVIIIGLTFTLTAFLAYRMNSLPNAGRVFVSIMYLFLPSCINPIIYGVRTTEIRQHILKMLSSCMQV